MALPAEQHVRLRKAAVQELKKQRRARRAELIAGTVPITTLSVQWDKAQVAAIFELIDAEWNTTIRDRVVMAVRSVIPALRSEHIEALLKAYMRSKL